MNIGLGELWIVLAVWALLIWAFYALVKLAVRAALEQFLAAHRDELAELVREAAAPPAPKGRADEGEGG
ncbi:hypothetical protein [Oceanithermus desulfurans]|uniref:CcmD family protein n=2 Tax=Oceanithermus desulfurans TaxID=227924 RepID=A0A511RL68_9DEIN|nr:hypothetical protein [Oceanithermus desulfurans]MBB6029845.1 hypothetical protein [Oceanithermus desulfurans]GEM89807.1 hypothetical protein ODE01S_12410 [Oceanithermus desulfurans NBRC 100063]